LLGDQLVRSGTDRFLRKPFLPDLLIVFGRDHPARAADVGGAEQSWEVGKRLLEMKSYNIVARDLDAVRFVL
jgi:hypothetical protein